MPRCLQTRCTEWMVDSMDRIATCLELIQEMRNTSSREAFWPTVRSRGEAAILEVEFLRNGNALMLELQEGIINASRERNRDVDEPVAVYRDGVEPPTGVLLTRGFPIQGTLTGRTDSSVPNHTRPPIREVPTSRDLWRVGPAEFCQENSHYPLTNGPDGV
jgi:hypothetical protein